MAFLIFVSLYLEGLNKKQRPPIDECPMLTEEDALTRYRGCPEYFPQHQTSKVGSKAARGYSATVGFSEHFGESHGVGV